jgi:hypothetical protein
MQAGWHSSASLLMQALALLAVRIRKSQHLHPLGTRVHQLLAHGNSHHSSKGSTNQQQLSQPLVDWSRSQLGPGLRKGGICLDGHSRLPGLRACRMQDAG